MSVFGESCPKCRGNLRLSVIEPHLWKAEYETQIFNCGRCGTTKLTFGLIQRADDLCATAPVHSLGLCLAAGEHHDQKRRRLHESPAVFSWHDGGGIYCNPAVDQPASLSATLHGLLAPSGLPAARAQRLRRSGRNPSTIKRALWR
jgi:hypothetical protein